MRECCFIISERVNTTYKQHSTLTFWILGKVIKFEEGQK